MESVGLVTMGFQEYGSSSSGPRTVAEANLKLLESRKYCDVAFIVGPYHERIECHQLMLMTRSVVFETQFRDYWTKSEGRSLDLEVSIPDVESRAFRLFLQYIYGDKADFSVPDALHVLYVAHKYKVESLIHTCATVLKREFDVKDVVQVYESAVKYSLPELEKDSMEFMAKNFPTLTASYQFSLMSLPTLIALLKRDDLAMEEIKIFEHVVEWAEAQMYKDGQSRSVSEVVEPLLSHIRFPLMTSPDFASRVVPSGLIAQDDVVALFVYYNAQGSMKNELGENLKYCCQGRNFWSPTRAEVKFYQPDHNIGHPDMLEFMQCPSTHEDVFEFLFLLEPANQPNPPRLPAITAVTLNGPNFSSFVSHPAYIARDVQLPTSWKVTLAIEKMFLPDYFGNNIDGVGPDFFTKSNVDVYAYMDVDVEIDPPIYLEHNSRYKIMVTYHSMVGVLPCETTGWRHDICSSSRIVEDVIVTHTRGTFKFKPLGPYEEMEKQCFDKEKKGHPEIFKSHAIRAIKVADA